MDIRIPNGRPKPDPMAYGRLVVTLMLCALGTGAVSYCKAFRLLWPQSRATVIAMASACEKSVCMR
jgi:hypothetical protein